MDDKRCEKCVYYLDPDSPLDCRCDKGVYVVDYSDGDVDYHSPPVDFGCVWWEAIG